MKHNLKNAWTTMTTTIQKWKCILTSQSIPDNDEMKEVMKCRRSMSPALEISKLIDRKRGPQAMCLGWKGTSIAYFHHGGTSMVLSDYNPSLTDFVPLHNLVMMIVWYSYLVIYLFVHSQWGSIQNPSLVWWCQKTPRSGLPLSRSDMVSYIFVSWS